MERKAARITRNGFREITASLRARIEAGEIRSGEYLPTERELQTQFAASRSTIRKALAALVDQGVARNVPNKGVIVDGDAWTRRSDQIALVDGGSDLLKLIGVRLSELLLPHGLHLVQMGGGGTYSMEYSLQRAMDLDFAGAIVWSYRGFPDVDLVSRAARQLPMVALDHPIEGATTDLVTLDHEAAAYMATEQLIRQGCRRIGVTGMLDMLDITHQRFSGYMRAMFAHDLQPEPKNFAFTFTSGDVGQQTDLLKFRLSADDRPDALLVLQDICVPTAVECALDCGLSVPGDLKMATLGDDVHLTVDGVGVTAVAFDWDALAEEAVRLVLDRLESRSHPAQVRTIPHRLIVRGMCGAPRGEWSPDWDRPSTFPGRPSLAYPRFVYSSRHSAGDREVLTRS